MRQLFKLAMAHTKAHVLMLPLFSGSPRAVVSAVNQRGADTMGKEYWLRGGGCKGRSSLRLLSPSHRCLNEHRQLVTREYSRVCLARSRVHRGHPRFRRSALGGKDGGLARTSPDRTVLEQCGSSSLHPMSIACHFDCLQLSTPGLA